MVSMSELPGYVGPAAMGLKMGVITPETDIVEEVKGAVSRVHEDDLLDDKDIVCITESVVARAQDNYIEVDEVAKIVKEALSLKKDSTIGVVFPITSRNRFSMILEAISKAVNEGEVVVQFPYPDDEVGNQVIPPELAEEIGKDIITTEDIGDRVCKHPITEVDYIEYYQEIIEKTGAEAEIILSNEPTDILKFDPDGVIAADIHSREKTKKAIMKKFDNCIKLDDICTDGEVCSEWGLLGSNMSSGDRLKLAPKNADDVVNEIQKRVKDEFGVEIEVVIYGDGAYKDPTSGIYELADPKPTIASTSGLNHFRRGVKYKYIADKYYHEEDKSEGEIEDILREKKKESKSESSMEKEGTTPRKMEDLLGSLADLVSGSADAGTPVVLVKNFLS